MYDINMASRQTEMDFACPICLVRSHRGLCQHLYDEFGVVDLTFNARAKVAVHMHVSRASSIMRVRATGAGSSHT